MVSPGYDNVVLFRYKYGEIDVTVINANVDDAMIMILLPIPNVHACKH